jgi:hypothetical protein
MRTADVGGDPIPCVFADHASGISCIGGVANVVVDAIAARKAGVAVARVVLAENAVRFECAAARAVVGVGLRNRT